MSTFSYNITSNNNTMESSDKENKYIRARERVEELKKFYGNLTSYVLVISGLALINYFTNHFAYAWFLWAAFGWGIGIVFHAIKTFDLNPFFGKQWEKRKLEQFMQEEEHKNKWK